MNKDSFVNELGDIIKKTNEDNSINSMNKPEIVDSMVENVVKKMM